MVYFPLWEAFPEGFCRSVKLSIVAVWCPLSEIIYNEKVINLCDKEGTKSYLEGDYSNYLVLCHNDSYRLSRVGRTLSKDGLAFKLVKGVEILGCVSYTYYYKSGFYKGLYLLRYYVRSWLQLD